MGKTALTVYLLGTLFLASACTSQNESGFSTDAASESDSSSNSGAGLVTTTTVRATTTTLRQTTTTLRPVTTTTTIPQYVTTTTLPRTTTTTVRATTTTTLPRTTTTTVRATTTTTTVRATTTTTVRATTTTTTLAPTTTTTMPAQTACSTLFPLKEIAPVKSANVKVVSGMVYNDLNKNMSFDSGEGGANGAVFIGGKLSGTGNREGGVLTASFWVGDQTMYLSSRLRSKYISFCTNLSEDMSLDIVNEDTLVTSNSMAVEGTVASVRVKGSKGLKIYTHLGNQNLVGGPGDDILSAGDDADILKGGMGNDVLIGGNGIDTAIFSGRSSQYSVSKNGNDVLISGADGADTNRQIEIYRFADGDFIYNTEYQRLVAVLTPAKTSIPRLGTCSNSFPLTAVVAAKSTDIKTISGVVYSDLNKNMSLDSGEGSARGAIYLGVKLSGTGNGDNGALNANFWAGDQTLYISSQSRDQYISFCSSLNSNMSLDVVNEDTLFTSNSMIVEGALASLRVKGSNGLTLIADLGNQVFVGGPGQDKLYGGADADIFDGRLGDDILDGGDGLDIAVYSGSKDQYTVRMSGGALTVSGPNAGNDTMYAVEILRFSDGDYIYSQELGRVVSVK